MGEPSRATLLVVDDASANLDTLLSILDGHDLIPATSGEEALAIIAEEKVDLVLLDIMMPGLDGFEVCRRLKARPETRDIPVIFITARDDEDSVHTAYASGAYDFVTKPFMPSELRSRVETQLTLRRQYLQLSAQNAQLAEAKQDLEQSNGRYREALDALQKSGENYRAVLAGTKDGFCLLDAEGRVLEVNAAYCLLSGYGVDELLSLGIADLDQSEPADAVLDKLARIAPVGGAIFESCHRRQDGSQWPVEASVNYTPQHGGRFFCFFRDITERKLNAQLAQLRLQLNDLVHEKDGEGLLRTAVDLAEHLTESQIGFFHFVDEASDHVDLQTWSTRTLGEMCQAEGEGLHYPISKAGVWVDCIHQRRPVIHNDYPSLPHRKGLPDGHAPLQRLLLLPVLLCEEVVAVIGVANKPRVYGERDIERVKRVGELAYDFHQRLRAELKIQQLAYNDRLTGLPNRELLADRLHQALSLARRTHQLLAICYLDLDGFKPVNDRLGHDAGDQLLIQLAARLQEQLREGDTLARLGGDEFIILLGGLRNVYVAEETVQRILQTVARPYPLEHDRVQVSASIGVTLFPQDDADADTLIRHADQAMYRAKEAGKNTYSLYDPVQDQKARSHRQDLLELEKALDHADLQLYYQPRVDLISGELAAVEALVRWPHPERGLLLPGDFLPLIDNHPLEFTLDEWVLRTALDQHMRWREQGLTLPVSVNLSPRQIQQPGFPAFLARLLASYPEDVARHLELEVLETSTFEDTAQVAHIMKHSSDLGVRFSLDDFGTGYSSLTYFHRLPISILKIDKGFVSDMLSDPQDQNIVEGVLRLAEALRRPVVAEGVESIELGLMLSQLGCQFAQGFGIARPMPADELLQWSRLWSTEGQWRELQADDQRPTPFYDLNVAIFIHRRWVSLVRQYLESGLSLERPPPEHGEHCQFSRWYKGIGATWYGKRPQFAFILSKHSALHKLAEEIIAQAAREGADAAQPRLAELEAISEELVEMLTGLSGA